MAIKYSDLLDMHQLSQASYPLQDTTGQGVAVLKETKRYGLWNRMSSEGRKDESGGDYIKIDLLSGQSSAARMAGPYDSTTIRPEQLFSQARAEWRRAEVYWTCDEMELRVNSSTEQRISLIRKKRLAAVLAILKVVIEQIVNAPSSTDADNLDANGVLYHFSEISGAQVTAAGGNAAVCGGFKGGNPYAADGTQFSTWQNVSRSSSDLLKNYCDTWASSGGFGDPTDISRIDNAELSVGVEAPINVDEALGVDWNWYTMTDRSNYLAMLAAARSQDMKLGPDIGEHMGMLHINNNIVKYEPSLDTVTNLDGELAHPFVKLNLNQFRMHILTDDEGMALSESPQFNESDNHTVLTWFLDLYFNLVAYNPQEAGYIISWKDAA